MEPSCGKQALRAAALFLAVLLLALTLVFNTVDRETLAETLPAVDAAPLTQEAWLPPFASEEEKEEVLWLARCIYSETKQAAEQELVAWVVRNRVETGYRGATSYREAVLDPWQFSAFNADSPKRRYYASLDETSKARGWQTAVFIAYDVMQAPAYERPFSKKTRHFFSERSMKGRTTPDWAVGQRPVSLDRKIDPRRFRFYANVS